MSKTTRILVAIASLSLLLVFLFPLWRISLDAPQYPEGLGMEIWVSDVRGVGEHDLKNINGLNHYIGMKEIHPEAIPELRYMPWIVVALAGLGVLTAALGRRWMLYGWVALLVAASVAGLADFWYWEHDYGHNLDMERAIIKVPGQSYQPPLIGTKQILNFKASAWPAAGGLVAMAVSALAAAAVFLEVRRARRGVTRA